jgi:glycolate oxidase FAD binding subunit
VATAAPAPLALGDLGVRDLVLGLTVVTGTGEMVRGGGRVVKNVAGFDLVRLHTGAFGTLGAITEVTLRLHAIPQVDAIVVGTLEHDLAHSLPTLIANRAPLPMLLHLAAGKAPELWARVSGNSARAAALTNRLVALGITGLSHVADTAPLRTTPANAIVLRARTALSDAVPFLHAARTVFPDAVLQYDPARGSLRVQLDGEHESLAARLAQFAAQCAAHGAVHAVSVIVEQGRRVPHERTPIEVGLKRAMDPHDVLNRLLADHVA